MIMGTARIESGAPGSVFSEARVEAIDGDIRLVCGDTGVIKSRLGCRVVSGRDCGADQRMTTEMREAYR